MNLEIIYNPLIITLFNTYFDNISKKYTYDDYSWVNIKNIFIELHDNLMNSIKKEILIKNYYILTFLYLNYTNYLKFINHEDFNNQDIYKFYKKIKFNPIIINNIIENYQDNNIKNIIKITNPFFNLKKNNIKDFINNSKQMDKLSEMNNNNSKKILNIIIYRFIHSSNINYSNYNEFFFKKILNNYNKNILNFDTFIKQIPNSKNLLDIKIGNDNSTIDISIIKILNFLKSKNLKLLIEKNNVNKYIITNSKYGGKLIINQISSINNIEFNHYQNNYSLIHYNIWNSNELNFLKKTNNFIEINLVSFKINDFSTLLHVIHLLTISFKFLESYPSDLYECIYPLDYSKYYFDTFCNFLEFIKPLINKNLSANKFIIDLIKYLYIYSYYDYYFYYSNNLIETIIKNYEFKNNIFDEFLLNLKNILKLPNELFNYPPFFDINDDINSIIYYNFEIPSYLKLFDLVNALCFIFDHKYYSKNPNDNSIINIICKYFYFSNKNDFNNKIISESEESSDYSTSTEDFESTYHVKINNDKFKSKINSEILSKFNKNDKILINNNNTYVEFNTNDPNDYILNTDK